MQQYHIAQSKRNSPDSGVDDDDDDDDADADDDDDDDDDDDVVVDACVFPSFLEETWN